MVKKWIYPNYVNPSYSFFKMDGLIIGWFGGKPTFFGNIHLWFSINLEARSLNFKYLSIFYPALEIPPFFPKEKKQHGICTWKNFPGSGSTFYPTKTALTFWRFQEKTNQPLSSWWLNQPSWTICSSNGIMKLQRGVNMFFLKPPPSYVDNPSVRIINSSVFNTSLSFFQRKNLTNQIRIYRGF